MILYSDSFERTFKAFSPVKNHFHFIGIGGIGMSGIAYACRKLGFRVSGSDLGENAQTQRLKQAGCRVELGHSPEHVGEVDAVIVSTAVPQKNPELLEARRRGIPILHRSELLQFLIMGHRCIAVAGTHGKTTITGMLAHVLVDAGFDPTVFVGGEFDKIGGNSRLGKSSWVVIEADESDRSFLNYTPEIAVVNNIDFDHAEFYADIEEIKAAFHEFCSSMMPGGIAFLGWDSEHVRELRTRLTVNTAYYGKDPNAGLWISDYRGSDRDSRFLVHRGQELLGEVKLKVPGRFNAANSLAVIGVGLHLRIPFPEIAKHLESFEGVRRRFQKKGEINGVTVIDDYAHHPAEIKATLSALAERYQGRKIGVFQPHRFSRTKALAEQFGKALEALDVLILADVYPASETPIPGIDGTTILGHVPKNGPRAEYVPEVKDIPAFLVEKVLKPGDVLITLGAGTITNVGDKVLEELRRGILQEV